MSDFAVIMTALRQKLIDEIQFRGFSIHTQDSYVRAVTGLARFYHRSPDQIVDDEIKAYLLHLLRIKKLAVSSIIVAVSALRFFFGQVLHRPTQAIEQGVPRRRSEGLPPAPVADQEAGRQFHHRRGQCSAFLLRASAPPPNSSYRAGPAENEETRSEEHTSELQSL